MIGIVFSTLPLWNIFRPVFPSLRFQQITHPTHRAHTHLMEASNHSHLAPSRSPPSLSYLLGRRQWLNKRATEEETGWLTDERGHLTFGADIWALSLKKKRKKQHTDKIISPAANIHNLFKEQLRQEVVEEEEDAGRGRRRRKKLTFSLPPLISMQITTSLLY